MDLGEFLRDFVDHASPKLDTYEQTIYLYVMRHTRLEGLNETVIPIESATIRLALGIAKKGARISRDVFRRKLQSLESKGFLRIVGKEYRGTRVRLFLPREIPGVIPVAPSEPQGDLEELDFFEDRENRNAIFAREGEKCFYCLVSLNQQNRVIDHIVSRPKGDNSYRNCVAACLTCNSEKGHSGVADFLRGLYRKGRLSASELDMRLQAVSRVQAGDEKPVLIRPTESGRRAV